jgi:predicted glycogen debranching enzyme
MNMRHDSDAAAVAGTPIRAVSVPRKVCGDFTKSSRLEWLETNGTGGFAMGTVSGANTRRYHGLLVASLRPPVDRFVLLSRLDEVVEGEPEVALSTTQYPGALHPTGYRQLLEFRLDPFPTWVWDVGGAHVEKQVFLVQGEQTAVVRYRSTRARRLRIAPFLAFRDYHSLTHANPALDGRVREERTPDALVLHVRPYPPLPELHLHASAGASFVPDSVWYYAAQYAEEQDRGLDFSEDLWTMGNLVLDVGPGAPAFVAATIGPRRFDDAVVEQLARAERDRRRARTDDAFRARLELAAEQFCVRRADGKPTLIAGYPWFTDWGRDTMIALPGLLLARGRIDEAREVLRGFCAHLDRGLIPNRFPDRADEQLEYNTVDATLWLFQAVFAWLKAGGSASFVRDEFLPVGKEILRWHREGTHHGIQVDPRDGLLTQGEPGAQLTWMDAKVGDRVITARHGKPVEINALYYNALRLMALWAQAFGDAEYAAACAREADLLATSFEHAFWNASRGALYDVLGPDGVPDASIRPNQIFAVALPFPLLDTERQKSVVRVVEQELLTPYGLRTLSRDNSAYVAHYRGGPSERDGAYHQGTVWPWLLGPFVRAVLTAYGRTPETVARCRELLRPLEEHLTDALLGSVGEVFDAEPPFHPGGCPAQAWSVAELLRLVAVDLAESSRDRVRRGAASTEATRVGR